MAKTCKTPPGGEGLAKIFPGGKHREINTKPLKKQALFTEDEEATIESDRRFFRRFQERRHYIRPACQGELSTLGAPTPPHGCAWFTVVKKVAPQCRMRRFIATDDDLIWHEPSEDDARAIWDVIHDREGGAK